MLPDCRRLVPPGLTWPLLAVILGLLVAAPLPPVLAAQAIGASTATQLEQAQVGLRDGMTQLEAGYRNQTPATVTAARGSFSRSHDRLDVLRRRLRALDLARSPVSPGPVRSRLTTLDGIVDVAARVDQVGVLAAEALLTSGVVGVPAAGDRADITRLTGLLASMRDELRQAGRAAGAIDLSLVPGAQRAALGHVIVELRAAVDGFDAMWPSIGAVLDLLGLDGPRTYLIEQVNPAELRSGGGFIGTVSLVHADHGVVTLAKSLPVEAFDYCDADACVHRRPAPWQPGYVAPPAELAGPPMPTYSQLSAWSLEDSGFFPDFASSATTAEMFARRLLGTPIDGVVAVDYYAVAPLIALTGPVALPKYGLTLTAENFVDTIVGLDLARDYAHKDVISAAAAQIVAGLSHLPLAQVPRLMRIVRDMVQARHLQVHFDAAPVQREAGRLGATEVVNPLGSPDFLLETEDNYGGSKANHFLQRRFRLELTHDGSVLQHRLTIDLHDGAPPERQYIGPHYFAYLRVTVPAAASQLSMASAPSPDYPPIEAPWRRTQVAPPGAQVLGGWIFVRVGDGLSGDYEATFSWDTPWQPSSDGSTALYWQKQAGTVRDSLQVVWATAGGTRSASGDLGEDRLVTLSPRAVAISSIPASALESTRYSGSSPGQPAVALANWSGVIP